MGLPYAFSGYGYNSSFIRAEMMQAWPEKVTAVLLLNSGLLQAGFISWRPLAGMFNSGWASTVVAMITIIIIITTPILFKWSPLMQSGLATLCIIWLGAHCELCWTPGGKLAKIISSWEEKLHLNMTWESPFYSILSGLTKHSKDVGISLTWGSA